MYDHYIYLLYDFTKIVWIIYFIVICFIVIHLTIFKWSSKSSSIQPVHPITDAVEFIRFKYLEISRAEFLKVTYIINIFIFGICFHMHACLGRCRSTRLTVHLLQTIHLPSLEMPPSL